MDINETNHEVAEVEDLVDSKSRERKHKKCKKTNEVVRENTENQILGEGIAAIYPFHKKHKKRKKTFRDMEDETNLLVTSRERLDKNDKAYKKCKAFKKYEKSSRQTFQSNENGILEESVNLATEGIKTSSKHKGKKHASNELREFVHLNPQTLSDHQVDKNNIDLLGSKSKKLNSRKHNKNFEAMDVNLNHPSCYLHSEKSNKKHKMKVLDLENQCHLENEIETVYLPVDSSKIPSKHKKRKHASNELEEIVDLNFRKRSDHEKDIDNPELVASKLNKSEAMNEILDHNNDSLHHGRIKRKRKKSKIQDSVSQDLQSGVNFSGERISKMLVPSAQNGDECITDSPAIIPADGNENSNFHHKRKHKKKKSHRSFVDLERIAQGFEDQNPSIETLPTTEAKDACSDSMHRQSKKGKKKAGSSVSNKDSNSSLNEIINPDLTNSDNAVNPDGSKVVSCLQKQSCRELNQDFLASNHKPWYVSKRVNETALDFNEDPVSFEIPPLHAHETVTNLKPCQKNELLSLGVKIKEGKFSPEEDVIICENFKNFARKHCITDPSVLLGIGRNTVNRDILKFIRVKQFYVRLGEGLCDRTLQSIYKRARLLFDAYRNPDEPCNVASLKWSHKMFGNKWQKLATTVGKNADCCLQTLRWHEKSSNKGRWTQEEEENLVKGVKMVMHVDNLNIAVDTIPWDKVAVFVPTRNGSQCRWHWANTYQCKPDLGEKWCKSHYGELVSILKKDWNVANASQIDWKKVYESFKNVTPSHLCLQKKWFYLKSKVPDYKNKNYKEILENLCIMYDI